MLRTRKNDTEKGVT